MQRRTPVVTPYGGESETKKEQVGRMFDRIARRYDVLNRLLSLGIDLYWRRKALRYLKNAPRPLEILDVATGTADVAILAAEMLKPCRVVGIDIASQMLNIGREKVARKGLQDVITLQSGDAEQLHFADESFDAVTVAFGVRNFEHLEKGLAEIRRVLRPKGRVIILEFSHPTVAPFKQIYHLYFKYVLPVVGRLTSGDQRAYTYLYESVQAFPQGNEFLDILNKTGFKHLQCEQLTLGICSIYTGVKG
ncbi:MAG: bifunctional demethylmenaquinone methyltransferase/2-methoxy-6-polyprenyl-1,4-benzoquinol methylase UbiE [Saprospiraceae bacterium]|nr:bifunctional demethylmenaquinone methyltransferase/2-methoxy-6-polyprenyl-1,4-benzoquinol methylase UbiE [Saprospiraceae bacterium]MDW8484361.1 bifunctional demethylmenaquinone methyltransferase/2-methoxy-6-polyprenyl-1,4-benzoquinol methylase UbiE [Saprospiraceae bacterium]